MKQVREQVAYIKMGEDFPTNAGFSGFNLHRKLEKAGIKSIVVNAPSIAVDANDKVKTDLRDSKKTSEQLSTKRLKAIYVPSKDEEARRTLTRTREQVGETQATASLQIKSKLHYHGLMAKDDKQPISNRYLRDVEKLELPSEVHFSFNIFIEPWRLLTRQLIELLKAK